MINIIIYIPQFAMVDHEPLHDDAQFDVRRESVAARRFAEAHQSQAASRRVFRSRRNNRKWDENMAASAATERNRSNELPDLPQAR